MASTESQKVPYTFNRVADIITDFIEVSFHTILCLRHVYHPDTFTRVKAYEVPVYQSRSPVLRGFIATFAQNLGREIKRGIVQRVTLVILDSSTHEALERFVFEIDYRQWELFADEGARDEPIDDEELKMDDEASYLIFQAFLVRLMALDSQLSPFSKDHAELTWVTELSVKKGTAPDLAPVEEQAKYDGAKMPQPADREAPFNPEQGRSAWAPATRSDGIGFPGSGDISDDEDAEGGEDMDVDTGGAGKRDRKGKGRAMDVDADLAGTGAAAGPGRKAKKKRGDPMFAVRSVETGVIDLNLMVQECMGAKRKKES